MSVERNSVCHRDRCSCQIRHLAAQTQGHAQSICRRHRAYHSRHLADTARILSSLQHCRQRHPTPNSTTRNACSCQDGNTRCELFGPYSARTYRIGLISTFVMRPSISGLASDPKASNCHVSFRLRSSSKEPTTSEDSASGLLPRPCCITF